jgi:hypothetical protein
MQPTTRSCTSPQLRSRRVSSSDATTEVGNSGGFRLKVGLNRHP